MLNVAPPSVEIATCTGPVEASHVRNNQLVGIALLFGERGSCLNALQRIGDGAIQRGPSGTQAEGSEVKGRENAVISELTTRATLVESQQAKDKGGKYLK